MRVWIGCILIRTGMAIVPRNVRTLVRNALLYHVPDALSPDEKADVEAAKAEWMAAKRLG